MIDVYNMKTKDNKEVTLVSKEYVDAYIKKVVDKLTYAISAICHTDASIEIDPIASEYKNIELDSVDKISTNDIEETDSRGFISKTALNSLLDRPTDLEVDKKIKSAKDEVLSELNELFSKLLNNPNGLDMIKMFKNMIEDNSAEVNDYVTKDDLNKHELSSSHMTSNDRKALNTLVDLMQNDKITNKEDVYDAINTILNNRVDSILSILNTKRSHDLVVGKTGEGYTTNTCDVIFDEEDKSNIYTARDYIETVNNGTICVRQGLYIFTKLNINKNVLFRCSVATSIYDTNINMGESSILDNGLYCICEIHLNHRASLANAKFEKCNIYLDGSYLNITGCTFTNCEFFYKGIITRCIITNNRFNGSKTVLLANDNIVDNNLQYR